MKSLILRYRRLLIATCHLVMVASSLVIAFLLRFDLSLPQDQTTLLLRALLIAMPVKMLVFSLGRLHRGWWRFVGVVDLLRILLFNFIASVIFTVAVLALIGLPFPRSIYLIDFMLCFLMTSGARFAIRIYREGLVVN